MKSKVVASGQIVGSPRPWSRERYDRKMRGNRDPAPWFNSRSSSSSSANEHFVDPEDRDFSTDFSFNFFNPNESLSMGQYHDLYLQNNAPDSAHWS